MRLSFRNSFFITGSTKEKIYDVIVSELESLRTDYIVKQENEISFRNRFWKFGSYAHLMSKADMGNFKLVMQGNDIELLYESSVSVLLDIVFIILLLIIGIIVHPVFIFGSILLIIQMIIHINTIRTGNKSLINKILSHF
jgi:hypothetical protein